MTRRPVQFGCAIAVIGLIAAYGIAALRRRHRQEGVSGVTAAA